MTDRIALKPIIRSVLIVLLLLLAFGPSCLAAELGEIQAAIVQKGAQWQAGETSMSVLPPAQQKLRLGLILPKDEDLAAAPLAAMSMPPAGLPVALDWTTPVNFVTPVRDQKSCGSCWAFATAAALESASLIKNTIPCYNLDTSEQVLVSCGSAGSCSGGYVDKASNYIRDSGLPYEACFPYTATNNTCSAACYNYQTESYRVQSWAYVTTTSVSVEAIKNALVSYGPLVTTMDVYADFFSYHGGVYSYVSGAYQGGHAILIVGYDDATQSFRAKNSWGTGWGEGGFFQIAYSAVGNPVYFGEFTIAYNGAAPQPPPPAPDPTPAACTFTISPTSKTFTDKGGKGSITVTTGAGCAWTASESSEWVTFTSGASKTGSGTVSYSIAPNTTASMRTTSIGISATGASSAAGSVSIIEKGRRR